MVISRPTRPALLRVDPKRLIELLRIAQHGSYTKAAEVQGISQPALSRSISLLEDSLGVELLNRTRHGAHLTEFGAQLVGHAKALESLLARAAEEVELKKRGLQGSIIIGVTPVACADLVPEAIVRLKATAPAVAIVVEEGPDDLLISRLQSGEIDLVVSPASPQTELAEIKREVLFNDSFIVAVRAKSKWSKLRNAMLEELRDAAWIMPNPDTVMWSHIQAFFAAENVPWPLNCVTSNSISAIKSLIARSEFVTITSRELMRPDIEAGQIVAMNMKRKRFTREICLRTLRDGVVSPIADELIKHLRKIAGEIANLSRN